MKSIILLNGLIITLGLFQPKPGAFQKFFYFLHNGKITPAISNNCKWQYALVKVKCNKNNKVISHQFLNNTSAEVKNYFKFIDGYQFDKTMPINRHPIVFCMTFENHNTDCILQNRTVPTDILKETFAALSVQVRADPKTIILYDMNTATYNHDPID